MYLSYPQLIEESPEHLRRLEREHRGGPLADRLKMLRLLKTGASRSRRGLAGILGYSERQLGRWFEAYRRGGLDALLERGVSAGSAERVTPAAWAGLELELKAGRIARLEDARQYLMAAHGITYAGPTSIGELFRRHKVKLKTGRRHHRKADPAQQAAFKK